MTTRWLLTGLFACCLLAATACTLFSPTTSAPPQAGGLRTLVIPDDAEVIVDGVSMGPASKYRGRDFIPVKGGAHQVEIRKEGYQPYRDAVFINNNMIMITVTLKKAE
ncbi:MAG TPA: PEGA domain-containing protein [Nitrospiria bacterium]|nr:PEGA domain-containing protein [Nitrospiria bacterium]